MGLYVDVMGLDDDADDGDEWMMMMGTQGGGGGGGGGCTAWSVNLFYFGKQICGPHQLPLHPLSVR